MGYYNDNITALKEYKPKLYSKLEKELAEYDHGLPSDVEFLEARDGNRYMQIKKDNNLIRLGSSYNPVREAVQWASQYSFVQYKNVVVMFGLGCGHFANALRELMQNSDRLIIYEPVSDVFFRILHEVDMTKLIKADNVSFVVGEPDKAGLYDIVSIFVHWSNVEYMKAVVHPGYDKAFADEYSAYVKEMNSVIGSIKVEGNTESFFGCDVANNTVHNLKYVMNANYLADFVGVFDKDTVGVVVAAGPSLDKNIQVLHDMKEKAVIFATDTSLKRLYEENIVPDFVVSVDPRKPRWMFENVGFENIPFLCKIDSNFEAMDIHQGHKIFVNPSEFFKNMFQYAGMEYDVEKSGGSVATMTFALCYTLRIKNIVLIGQDLAYQGGFSHAGKKNMEIMNEENTITYVKGNYEERVKTRGDWLIYLEWYERMIKSIPEGVRVINATEGGAYIEGTELMTLREVCDTMCVEDKRITEVIENVLSKSHEDKRDKILEFFEQCVKDIKAMKQDFEKAVTLCNRFERKYEKSRILTSELIKCMKDISRINKRIGDMPVFLLIDEMIKSKDKDSIKGIYEGGNDEYTSNMNMIRNTRQVFRLSLEALSEIKDDIFEAVADMRQQL